MQRILIIQTAFLGDVILATPLISELNRIYPNVKIDLVVRKGNESLLSNNPKINHIYVWDKKGGKYKNLFRVIKELRTQIYDEVITLQRFVNAGLMTMLSKSKSKIGFKKNAFQWMYSKSIEHSLLEGTHEVERNLKLIAHHGAEKLIRPELFPSIADFEKVQAYKAKPYYCLAPASVWETKKLPSTKWIDLIRTLLDSGQIMLIGGPGDFNLCEDIKKNFEKGVMNLAGELSLMQSAALIKDAQMNFVNDSGPLHIASAMNAPTRAFFCSTVPKFGFGPLADNSRVIQTEKVLSCRPCGFHGHKKCPLGHFDCGNSIAIDSSVLD